ncbi:MAG: hypothetical protein M1832_002428 [Thelocarpon impressellum]|nr:MAG: hypothetical protein M1832_002428 [Thelocarpon impressellum]
MARTPPFRNRPNLRLALTSVASSPTVSRYGSPTLTPLGSTSYSPLRSANLAPPTPYGGPVQFAPKSSRAARGRHYASVIRRVLSRRILWLAIVVASLIWWWGNGGRNELESVRLASGAFGKDIFGPDITKGRQFYPASNPKVHYVGRWTSSPNRLRMDGTFPGVYFDITVNSTTTLLLSLHNSAGAGEPIAEDSAPSLATASPTSNLGHVSFQASSLQNEPAAPISLLARIDQDEYILLPNASSLVFVRLGDLDSRIPHDIRVIAPMTDGAALGTVELEGIWLDKGGRLLRVQGSQLAEEVETEDALHAENENVGEEHRVGLNRLHRGKPSSRIPDNDGRDNDSDKSHDGGRAAGERKRVLEIITDAPGSLGRGKSGGRVGGGYGILGGVMGWEYLIGEMFGVDHVGIGVDGMCLMQDCIGGTGSPAGLGDVFFRSGPSGSQHFERPWIFHSNIPDVMILNIGTSDYDSIEKHRTQYNRTAWELYERFEDTYVSLVRAIRQLAYPKHPSVAAASTSGSLEYSPYTAPANIPIFIMRPLRGQFEHATQGAVDRLRMDGDTSVFWLDTSGWLDLEDRGSDEQDFYREDGADPRTWRLTERGNQRVAIFLHMHVCRFLAHDADRCAFLPPDVYHGKVFDPDAANFDKYIENEKERKLKKLFWEGEGDAFAAASVLGVDPVRIEIVEEG